MDEKITEEYERGYIAGMEDVFRRAKEVLVEIKSKLTEEQPPETPPTPQIDAKRLDRIWKYLQAFIPAEVFKELDAWAVRTFGYTYYTTGQKYPVDLRTAVCNKLKDFTEVQIAELEKMMEAKE